jgi:formamidopyrimidine-DNA glycosylase
MPELPEVEIVKQSLNRNIKFQEIKKVVVRNRSLRFKIPKDFESFLINKKIDQISRKSKYLIIHLNNNTFCIIHLGMSGTIHLVSKKNSISNTNTSFYSSSNLPLKHNHFEIFLTKYRLIYNDPRRFGFVKILKNQKYLLKYFKNIGPEPLNKKFNINYICSYLINKKKNIKNFLLDQKFVSGIGNIYASEILFHCKINPFKKAKNLRKLDIKKIEHFSKLILNDAIKKGGSSIRDFKNVLGQNGNYQNEFKVYKRTNLNCLNKDCFGKIKKKVISKRSTFFCNRCQK